MTTGTVSIDTRELGGLGHAFVEQSPPHGLGGGAPVLHRPDVGLGDERGAERVHCAEADMSGPDPGHDRMRGGLWPCHVRVCAG